MTQSTDPAQFLASLADGERVAINFEHTQYYLPEAPSIELHALVWRQAADLYCVIHDAAFDSREPRAVTEATGRNIVCLTQPLPLQTVRIAKPWGAEIWYTGAEARGICSVGGTPLPWLVELDCNEIIGAARRELVLLKVLDPLPQENYGDLYFEMHEQKIEVYIVTHVDAGAWPDGTGGIRFGFDTSLIEQHGGEAGFRDAWLQQVAAYRAIRVEIDNALDRIRADQGIAADAVIDPATIEAWKREIDPGLQDAEVACREAMHAFTRIHPLEVGDVVRVPNFTPHSLQHGVRVVEFQTPHYERYILSFAQKVLTQAHWDTEAAADKIRFDATLDKSLQRRHKADDHAVDEVANFEAFEVLRISLSPGATYEQAIGTYAVAMVIGEPATINGTPVGHEEAVLVPASMATLTVKSDYQTMVLIALPATGG